jgi:hypothetical protein
MGPMDETTIEFSSFQKLKNFLEGISLFLDKKITPFQNYPDNRPLLDIEEELIIRMYNSYENKKPGNLRDLQLTKNGDKEKIARGKIIKQISGKLLQLLQLLVPGDRFTNNFRELIYLEWMEHLFKSDNEVYRDHILHQANVCWVGSELIFKKEFPFYRKIKSALRKILAEQRIVFLDSDDSDEKWADFIRITWIITALVHDFGYAPELIKAKFGGGKLFSQDSYESHFSGFIPLFKRQIEKINPSVWTDPFLNSGKDHSVISSLKLLHFLVENREKFKEDKKWYSAVYQLAALGIFQHHIEKGEIELDSNPFGYMLILADTMHEWERYINVGTSQEPYFIAPITKVIFTRTGKGHFRIEYVYNPEILKYKPFRDRLNSGMLRRKMEEILNRLKSGNIPLKFEVHFREG